MKHALTRRLAPLETDLPGDNGRAASLAPTKRGPKLRVAHLTLSLNVGGLERLICDLARCAAAVGDEVFVICLDEPGLLADDLQDLGVRVLTVRRHRGPDPGLALRLRTVLREHRISVVHTHSLDPMFYGGIAARLAGVQARVHTQHNTRLAEWPWRDRAKFRIVAPLFRRVVAVSAETARILRSFGVSDRQLITVTNGVDEERFVPADRRHTGVPTLCTVARLSPEKGIRYLLKACAGLKAAGYSFNCVIAGEGPERTSLESVARTLNLGPTVRFVGNQQDIPSLLQQASVFVLPSLTEGTPLAVLEAMSVGLPIVATAVGGVPEIVDADAGRLVPAGDAAALQSAIASLLDDPHQRDQFGAAGRRHVEARHGLKAMAQSYRFAYAAASR